MIEFSRATVSVIREGHEIMRNMTICCICVIFAMLILVPSEAFTDCPEDKMEVTIVQGSTGKVMTKCVSEADLPHIGGVGDIIIPAVCPCDDIGLKWIADISCSDKKKMCISNYQDYIHEVKLLVQCPFHVFPNIYYQGASYSWIEEYGYCGYYLPFEEQQKYGLTVDEVKACAAKVWAFAVHELGLDCVGVFPDFEPPPMP